MSRNPFTISYPGFEMMINAQKPIVSMASIEPADTFLDHTHCRAICEEIGDRLREVLDRNTSRTPPNLQRLIDRLADLERESAPSIVPSFDELDPRIAWGILEPA